MIPALEAFAEVNAAKRPPITQEQLAVCMAYKGRCTARQIADTLGLTIVQVHDAWRRHG